MPFTLGRRCRCVVASVTRACWGWRVRRSGLRRCHVGRALRSGTFACTTTAASSATTTAAAAPTAFGPLGAAFRRRCCGRLRGVLTERLGVAVAILAIDGLALRTVALSWAFAGAVAPALRCCLVTATAVAVAIPVGLIPPTIPVAALAAPIAAAVALASGTFGIA